MPLRTLIMLPVLICLGVTLTARAATLESSSGSSTIPLSTQITRPYTHPWDQSLRPNTSFLPLETGIAANNATGDEPSQIHLSIAGQDEVFVLWATGNYKVGKGDLVPNDANIASIVRYGLDEDLNLTATGYTQTYSQLYNASYDFWGGATTQNYTSPVLHTVVLRDLVPGQTYSYQVGDGETFSEVLEFQALNAPGPTFPQRLLAIADWGLSENSSTTLDHIVQSALEATSPPLVLYIADFCYADTWYPNGTVSRPNTAVEGNPNAGTYQPVWDAWQRFVQPLVGQVPMIGSTGNHEIEQQDPEGARNFVSVQHRWPTPFNNSQNSPSYFFYSVNAGPTHNIMLSNYVDPTPGSELATWLEADLKAVDRSMTPFVTVSFHNPWYTTDSSYKEFEQMRISLEPITYAYGVDIFFYGHVHSYERTHPVNNWTVDPCGSVHITIGDGGNSEGISFLEDYGPGPLKQQFEDLNAGCPNVSAAQPRPSYLVPLNPSADPFSWFERTLTFQADGNSTGVGNPPGYCYDEQPEWSAYRESSFGHGTLDIIDSTTALWQWHRNQDAERVSTDAILLIRDPVACPNKNGAASPAPAPAVAVAKGSPAASVTKSGDDIATMGVAGAG